jgi:hypothetical protein
MYIYKKALVSCDIPRLFTLYPIEPSISNLINKEFHNIFN